jgi:hypothetical protein
VLGKVEQSQDISFFIELTIVRSYTYKQKPILSILERIGFRLNSNIKLNRPSIVLPLKQTYLARIPPAQIDWISSPLHGVR